MVEIEESLSRLSKLINYIKENPRKGSLRELLENYTRTYDLEGFPGDDRTCQELVLEAMDFFFEQTGTDREEKEIPAKHPFITLAQQNAARGSLRELFSNFFTRPRGELPRDDSTCYSVVSGAMETHFRVKEGA